jgi:hypothetical protein
MFHISRNPTRNGTGSDYNIDLRQNYLLIDEWWGTCPRSQAGYVCIVHTICDGNRGCRTSNTTQNNLVVVVVVVMVVVVVVVVQEHDVNAE